MPRPQHHRQRSGPSRGRTPSRPKRKSLLIVCEGRETEYNYFHGLKQEEFVRKFFDVKVKRGKGGSRDQIAQFAVEQKEQTPDDFDEVWCVMDVEHPDAIDAMQQASILLERKGISTVLSNPSVEVWFLAHFERTGRSFLHGDAAVKHLNSHWKKHFAADYDKADEKLYSRISPHTETAIANAKWVRENHHESDDVIRCNSSTNMDILVQKLRHNP
jgi:hypothetical protein